MQQLWKGSALYVLHLYVLPLQSLHQARQILQCQGDQGLLRHLFWDYTFDRIQRWKRHKGKPLINLKKYSIHLTKNQKYSLRSKSLVALALS